MNWVVIIGVTWLAVSVVAASLIAGAIRVADRHRREEAVVQRHAPAADAGKRPRFAPHPRSPETSRRRAWPPVGKNTVRDCVPSSERSGAAHDTPAR